MYVFLSWNEFQCVFLRNYVSHHNIIYEFSQASRNYTQEWEEEDEAILRQAGIIKEPSIPTDFSDFLMQDANILEIPSFDEENLQESVKKYKQRMKQLQETNDALFRGNRVLVEELQDVHRHFLELSEVSKEVLNRKRTSDKDRQKLEKTVKSLQQENEDL